MNFSGVTGPFIHPVSILDQGSNTETLEMQNEPRAGSPEINYLEMTERFLARPDSGAMTLKEINEALKQEKHSHDTELNTVRNFNSENISAFTLRHELEDSGKAGTFQTVEGLDLQKVKSVDVTEEIPRQNTFVKLEEVSCSNSMAEYSKQGSGVVVSSDSGLRIDKGCKIEQATEHAMNKISIKIEKGCQTYAFTDKSIPASKMVNFSEDECKSGNVIADRELPYKCKFCGSAFSLFSHLKHHVKIHEEDAEFSCDTCGRVYVSDNELQRHKKKHCRPKTHKCTECGNCYRLMHQLQSHLRTHTGEKPFLCESCGQGFSQKESLRLHERTHTGYKPHKCAICGKTFNSTKCLHRHELTHSGERNYRCDICGKSYQRNDHLRRHKRVHGEEPRFKCSYCGKGFHQKVNLEEHERIHTGTRPFGCDVCGKSFTQRGNLKSHLMKHSFV